MGKCNKVYTSPCSNFHENCEEMSYLHELIDSMGEVLHVKVSKDVALHLFFHNTRPVILCACDVSCSIKDALSASPFHYKNSLMQCTAIFKDVKRMKLFNRNVLRFFLFVLIT